MNEWVSKVLDDIRRGSAIQFVVTIILIVSFTGYEVTRGLSPLATTAILYWDGGFTEEELERSGLHGLCDNMTEWPMSVFGDPDLSLKDKCKYLKKRHMMRTAEDWKLFQRRARELQSNKSSPAKKREEPSSPAIKRSIYVPPKTKTPKEEGMSEEQPP